MVAVTHPYLGYLNTPPTSIKLLDETSEKLAKIDFLQSHDNYQDCRDGWERFQKSHMERKSYIGKYGFSIYSKETLDALAQYLKQANGPTLEIFAGSGYLSDRLAKRGTPIIASDKGAATFEKYKIANVYKRDIECDVFDLNLEEFQTVIMAWPEMNLNAYLIAQKMQPGQVLIYVGEEEGGCTATEEFFNEVGTNWERLDGVEAQFNQHHYSFLSIYDSFFVFRKI